MLNQRDHIEIILEKDNWNDEERRWLLEFLGSSDTSELKELMLKLYAEDLESSKTLDPAISERLIKIIHQEIGFNKKGEKAKLLRIWTLRMAVACIISFLTISIYLIIKNNLKQPIAQNRISERKYKNDIQPGGNKALLTLADGSTIVLDDAKNGALVKQGNTEIIKMNGRLNYNSSGSTTPVNLFNTIITPRGGQYKVELPDGSQAWLNSVSSLRFPIAFTGKQRRVEVTGEVYFEVAKNKAIPFIVSAAGSEIQVLGTHFNVMAYNDEATLQTTLLEGAVKFVKDGNIAMLKPGQQSQLTKNGLLKVVSDVDLGRVVAWKNGFFDFEGSDFETIARQISRWYDVEVIYNKKINDEFFAEIPRNTKLSDVLKALEMTGKVRFEIEEKKVIVMP